MNSIKLLTMRNNYWLKTASNKKFTPLMYHICSKIILAHVLFCQGDLIANLEHTIWVMTMIFWRYFPKPKIWRKIFSWSHRHGYRYDMIYIALRFWDMDIDIISGFGLRYGIWYYIGMKRYFTMTVEKHIKVSRKFLWFIHQLLYFNRCTYPILLKGTTPCSTYKS